ncbi:metalloprotease 1 [Microdochium trichocladiopsis]|uniref:Metalloprotease 1 n=1 Tax=Microdochium trichocladiopsis TaxID=1682393 RepID=A0A9P8XSA2_9PEZI|nr:metalloprotease 1 [Microdochium trichocladiopsis]KAH7014600.1 metalloprotease 1 [Microdochium trichocladiopsis]
MHRNASVIEAANAAMGIVDTAATLVVDTYFHVVALSKNESDGYIPQAAMTKQLQVMNAAYQPYGIQFNLKGTDWTINKRWAVDKKTKRMKAALRKGDYKTLNIYFQKRLKDDNLGYCYFPRGPPKPGSKKFIRDGCSIDGASVPGGAYTGYNLGLTAVHEVGHWFGLLHTFEGQNCAGTGDFVADTPQQISATVGCPEGRDSCPSSPGLDPIHNYMDYSTDACYTQFTEGQRQRMITMYNTYRKNS